MYMLKPLAQNTEKYRLTVAERTSLSLGFTPICALGSANDIVTPTELAPLDVSLTVAVARRPSAEVTRTVIM